jgi:(p)ppGpp synthase/HD superfamily hydrolase
MNSDNTKRMRELIRQQLGDKKRRDGKSGAWHSFSVASIMQTITKIGQEIDDPALLDDMIVAALGHDLVEDTPVTTAALSRDFSGRSVEFIDALTNHQDDQHTAIYMRQLAQSPEEVCLIKYCDLIDNINSVRYGVDQVGRDWVESFFLPIMKSTIKALGPIKIQRYKKTFKILRSITEIEAELLYQALDRG